MQEFEFRNVEEFEKFFDKVTFTNPDMCEKAVKAIRKGLQDKVNTAHLYKIDISSTSTSLIISLPQSEWSKFLKQVIEIFHQNEKYDLALDTWKLNESLKNIN